MFIGSIWIHISHKPLRYHRILSGIIAFYFSHLLNDIFDHQIDSTHHNRSNSDFVKNPLGNKVWIKLAISMVCFWALEGFSLESFMVTVFFILYTPVLKRIVGVKNLTVVVFMVYTFYWVSPVSPEDIPALVFQAMYHLRYEIIKDIVDMDNDLKHGIYTIPNFIGVESTKTLLLFISIIHNATHVHLNTPFSNSASIALFDHFGMHNLTACKIFNKIVYFLFLGQWYKSKQTRSFISEID